MNKPLYLYALIKSLYDKGEDYIDSFWPFVIQVSSVNKPKTINELQAEVHSKFSLDIPLHVLKTIISRAKHNNLLTQKDSQYVLTKEGEESLNKFEDEDDVRRRIEALMKDIVNFFGSKNVVVTSEDVYNLVSSFIQSNLSGLVDYLNPKVSTESLNNTNNSGNRNNENLLVQYFMEAQADKPKEYEVLKEMVYGSIISVILNVPESADLNEIKNPFRDCIIYLDSNIALSVLGLTSPERNEPAQELIKLIKNFGIELRILDITVYQIRRVIGGFSKNYDLFDPSIRVDSIYSDMQIAGWVPSDVQEYLFNLENKFSDLGIKIEYTDLTVDTEKPFNNRYEILKQYKTNSEDPSKIISPAGLNHDLIAIEKIRSVRKRPVITLEDSKALFLTSDAKLHWFDFKEMGHRDSHTISEVILDRILANILWLKNPNIELPLKSIIATHSRNLFIKKGIWSRFYEVLKRLEQENKVTEEQISLLFYSNDMEKSLKQFDDQETEKVTEEFVLNGIEQARKNVTEKIEIENEKARGEFLKKLKESEAEMRLEAEKSSTILQDKLDKVRKGVRRSATGTAAKIVWPSIFILAVVILYAVYYLVFIRHVIQVNTLSNMVGVSGVSVVAFLVVMYKIGKKLVDVYSKKIYTKELILLELDK